jgi:dephospho-CoA kinase
MKTSLNIALIGGIGSGKTTALNFFKSKHIFTISADDIARQLTLKGEGCYEPIKKKLGEDYLDKKEDIDRIKMRELFLKDPNFKSWLEDLIHPKVREKIHQLLETKHFPYSVIEIPVLTKREDYPIHRVLYIQTKKSKQMENLAKRDLSKDEVAKLLTIQIPSAHCLEIADDIIENNSTLERFIEKLEALHIQYLKTGLDSHP